MKLLCNTDRRRRMREVRQWRKFRRMFPHVSHVFLKRMIIAMPGVNEISVQHAWSCYVTIYSDYGQAFADNTLERISMLNAALQLYDQWRRHYLNRNA